MPWVARLTAVPCLVLTSSALLAQADPLPSWNDTVPKQALVAFVERVTRPDLPEFVPPLSSRTDAERLGKAVTAQMLVVFAMP
jgi:hypothetical protein